MAAIICVLPASQAWTGLVAELRVEVPRSGNSRRCHKFRFDVTAEHLRWRGGGWFGSIDS
jgi:hypothetical protein